MTDLHPNVAEPWHPYRSDPASLGSIGSRVHVWRVGLDRTEATAGDNLSSEEAARADRLTHRDDRRRFVQARGVLRRILADVLGSVDDPRGKTLRIGHEPAGKPFLADDPRLHFNVSHSEELAVIALTRVGAVGIDVERQRAVSDREAIARLVFDDAERAALLACPTDERDGMFYRLWTRKEALLKAMGVGLPALADPDAPDLTRAATGWRVTSLPQVEGYEAALARPRDARGLRLWTWDAAAALGRVEPRAGGPRGSARVGTA